MNRSLDFRSDALTEPTPEMWSAMRSHEFGWAMKDEDAAVLALEAETAGLLGKDAGLFCVTGSLANLVALMSMTAPGDRVVLEATSHILCCETDGIGYVCGVVPVALEGRDSGRIDPAELERTLAFAPFGHGPSYRLLCLENPHNYRGGTVLDPSYLEEVASVARAKGLRLHLDGARIFNAAAAAGTAPRVLASPFDTVMVNLNKGVSAPGGAVLCGPPDIIGRAKTARARLGGGSVSKAGYWAVAGLVGLRSAMESATRDNKVARILGEHLSQTSGLTVRPAVETNIVRAEADPELRPARLLQRRLDVLGVRTHLYSEDALRFTIHRHVTERSVDLAASLVEDAIASLRGGG